VVASHELTCSIADTVVWGDIETTQNNYDSQTKGLFEDLHRAATAKPEDLKAEIKAKADSLGGWMVIKRDDTNKTYDLPKNAFLKWCLSQSPIGDSIEWNPISPRGMKMAADDPMHTDWYLFVDEELNSYDSADNEFWFGVRSRINEEYTESELTPLIKGKHKGFNETKVVHVASPEDIEKIGLDHVVIIPTASPEFEMVAHKCAKNNCVVITEVGGRLCHLAVVGRELGLTLYMMPDAIENIPDGCNVRLKLTGDIPSINVQDIDAEELMVRLKKRNGLI
jgi:phosphohistidine swiveling domain-containing protein